MTPTRCETAPLCNDFSESTGMHTHPSLENQALIPNLEQSKFSQSPGTNHLTHQLEFTVKNIHIQEREEHKTKASSLLRLMCSLAVRICCSFLYHV